ncbi:MAG: hypothetical protein AAGN66_27865 [Acidobacteriota bacterium]
MDRVIEGFEIHDAHGAKGVQDRGAEITARVDPRRQRKGSIPHIQKVTASHQFLGAQGVEHPSNFSQTLAPYGWPRVSVTQGGGMLPALHEQVEGQAQDRGLLVGGSLWIEVEIRTQVPGVGSPGIRQVAQAHGPIEVVTQDPIDRLMILDPANCEHREQIREGFADGLTRVEKTRDGMTKLVGRHVQGGSVGSRKTGSGDF